jgi:hypothetical protein
VNEYNELVDINDDVSNSLNKAKEELESHMRSCSQKYVKIPINREEIDNMKLRMNELSSTLNKYAFDNSKIETLVKKKLTHTSQASHNSHTHKSNHSHHAYMYTNVYKCAFCGRKGHISKFCYDRLNVRNNNTWVKKTNTSGPKSIWVPKSSQKIVDIGTNQVQPTYDQVVS